MICLYFGQKFVFRGINTTTNHNISFIMLEWQGRTKKIRRRQAALSQQSLINANACHDDSFVNP